MATQSKTKKDSTPSPKKTKKVHKMNAVKKPLTAKKMQEDAKGFPY